MARPGAFTEYLDASSTDGQTRFGQIRPHGAGGAGAARLRAAAECPRGAGVLLRRDLPSLLKDRKRTARRRRSDDRVRLLLRRFDGMRGVR